MSRIRTREHASLSVYLLLTPIRIRVHTYAQLASSHQSPTTLHYNEYPVNPHNPPSIKQVGIEYNENTMYEHISVCVYVRMCVYYPRFSEYLVSNVYVYLLHVHMYIYMYIYTYVRYANY